MIKVNVIVDCSKWNKKIFEPKKYIKKKIDKIEKKNFLRKKPKEFSLLLTNNKKMIKLNTKFRYKNKTTDVLSFPWNNKHINRGYAGDVAVCFEIVNQRSKKTNFYYEFDKLWFHGYLHLIGFDHKSNKDYSEMTKVEKKFLNYFDYNL